MPTRWPAEASRKGKTPPPVPSLGVPLVVQKFGGTSIASAARMREVADHVKHCRSRGDDDRAGHQRHGFGDRRAHPLWRAQISDEPAGREMDMLITAGEHKAIALHVHGTA